MEHTHFWQNVSLIGIIIGAAILCAMLGTAGHAATAMSGAALAGLS